MTNQKLVLAVSNEVPTLKLGAFYGAPKIVLIDGGAKVKRGVDGLERPLNSRIEHLSKMSAEIWGSLKKTLDEARVVIKKARLAEKAEMHKRYLKRKRKVSWRNTMINRASYSRDVVESKNIIRKMVMNEVK